MSSATLNMLWNGLKNGGLGGRALITMFFRNFTWGFTGLIIVITLITSVSESVNTQSPKPFIRDFALRLATIDNKFYEMEYTFEMDESLGLFGKFKQYFKYYGGLLIDLWWLVMLVRITWWIIGKSPLAGNSSAHLSHTFWTIAFILLLQSLGSAIYGFEEYDTLVGETGFEKAKFFAKEINPVKGLVKLGLNIGNVFNPVLDEVNPFLGIQKSNSSTSSIL